MEGSMYSFLTLLGSGVFLIWVQFRAIYSGLLAWDKKSGVSYDNSEYGCGVTDTTRKQWEQHLAEHKSVLPYANRPWPWFSLMKAICHKLSCLR